MNQAEQFHVVRPETDTTVGMFEGAPALAYAEGTTLFK